MIGFLILGEIINNALLNKKKSFNKVFCIGVSRTGTSSLQIALNKLGIMTKNFPIELLEDLNHPILQHFDAFCDLPIPYLYKELDQRFPGSKFILSTRDKKDWLKSMQWLFHEGRIIYAWNDRVDALHEEFYNTSSFDDEVLSEFYDQYHSEVMNYFKGRNEDFLQLRLEENFDFEELIKFLDLRSDKKGKIPRINVSRKPRLHQKLYYWISKKLL